jgi:hypothetical protein
VKNSIYTTTDELPSISDPENFYVRLTPRDDTAPFDKVRAWLSEIPRDEFRPALEDARGSLCIAFDRLATATYFRIRFSDEFMVTTGVRAVLSRANHTTAFIVKPAVHSGTGEPRAWCGALEAVFGGIAFHMDHNTHNGWRSPLVWAIKDWLATPTWPLHRWKQRYGGDWNVFVVAPSDEHLVGFVEDWHEHIVDVVYVSDLYIERAVAHFNEVARLKLGWWEAHEFNLRLANEVQ